MEGLSSKWSQAKQSFGKVLSGGNWSWKLTLQVVAVVVVCLGGLALLMNSQSDSEESSDMAAEEDLLKDLESLSAGTSGEGDSTEDAPERLSESESQEAQDMSSWGRHESGNDEVDSEWMRSSDTSYGRSRELQTAEYREEAETESSPSQAVWLTGKIEEVESGSDLGSSSSSGSRFGRREGDSRFSGGY